MAEKETVIVEGGERRSSSSWIVILIALILLVLFFMFGGFSMFSGQSGTGTNTPVTSPTTTTPAGTGQ